MLSMPDRILDLVTPARNLFPSPVLEICEYLADRVGIKEVFARTRDIMGVHMDVHYWLPFALSIHSRVAAARSKPV